MNTCYGNMEVGESIIVNATLDLRAANNELEDARFGGPQPLCATAYNPMGELQYELDRYARLKSF